MREGIALNLSLKYNDSFKVALDRTKIAFYIRLSICIGKTLAMWKRTFLKQQNAFCVLSFNAQKLRFQIVERKKMNLMAILTKLTFDNWFYWTTAVFAGTGSLFRIPFFQNFVVLNFHRDRIFKSIWRVS